MIWLTVEKPINKQSEDNQIQQDLFCLPDSLLSFPAGRLGGVTGAVVRWRGAAASSRGALHPVSTPQETGKSNLLPLPNPQPSPVA